MCKLKKKEMVVMLWDRSSIFRHWDSISIKRKKHKECPESQGIQLSREEIKRYTLYHRTH
jgi:hypothetical protein